MTIVDSERTHTRPPGGPDNLADRAGASLVILALLGATFGALTAMTRHGMGPAAHLLAQVMGSDWAWLFVGLLACWGGQTYGLAAVRGAVFMTAAVVGNYVSDALSVVYTPRAYAPLDVTPPPPAPRLEWSLLELAFWLLLAILAGIALAAVLVIVRMGGARAVAAALILPLYSAGRAMIDYRRLAQQAGDPGHLRVLAGVAIAGIGVATIILGAAARRRRQARRVPPSAPAAHLS